ncbi:unnamed protein product [Rangifer tarandus platyrhynchus]|uniref:Uncharacterized protein n=1 Tax=Rangifer tarandus platyrhynchus TaxID=3082113 RepID=A0ABN8XNY0_RANTA|nr:unnamed protein product [Rangifer tarandus platyrhynchus]
MNIIGRALCIFAVRADWAAAAAATAAPKAAEDGPLDFEASSLIPQPQRSRAESDNFSRRTPVNPERMLSRTHAGKVPPKQGLRADVRAPCNNTSLQDLQKQHTALQPYEPLCRRYQSENVPRAWQRQPNGALQQRSLDTQEHNMMERRKRPLYFKKRKLIDLRNKVQPLKRPPVHDLQQGEKSEQKTFQVPLVGGQQHADKQHNVLQHREQDKPQQEQSTRPRPQPQAEKKLPLMGYQHGKQNERLESRRRLQLSGPLQQQHEGPGELHQLQGTRYRQHNKGSRGGQTVKGLLEEQVQPDLISLRKPKLQLRRIAERQRVVQNMTYVPRALQHIVQRQVFDFETAREQREDGHRKREDGKGHNEKQVQPVEAPPGSAPDVREQEQKVLWGGTGPDMQLPQRVNLSQVLIQNSAQLFFNQDKHQQRGNSTVKPNNESGGTGEYNWQQHVRGQPGRSDGEEQQREQEAQQERLQQEQQRLLDELFALGREIDKGQRLLRRYQTLRQHLQMLHLQQDQLVQQLQLVKKQGKQKEQQERMHQRQQQQNLSLVPTSEAGRATCAADNYPLFESFLQWNRLQEATTQLLALNPHIFAAGEDSAKIPAASFATPFTSAWPSIEHNSQKHNDTLLPQEQSAQRLRRETDVKGKASDAEDRREDGNVAENKSDADSASRTPTALHSLDTTHNRAPRPSEISMDHSEGASLLPAASTEDSALFASHRQYRISDTPAYGEYTSEEEGKQQKSEQQDGVRVGPVMQPVGLAGDSLARSASLARTSNREKAKRAPGTKGQRNSHRSAGATALESVNEATAVERRQRERKFRTEHPPSENQKRPATETSGDRASPHAAVYPSLSTFVLLELPTASQISAVKEEEHWGTPRETKRNCPTRRPEEKNSVMVPTPGRAIRSGSVKPDTGAVRATATARPARLCETHRAEGAEGCTNMLSCTKRNPSQEKVQRWATSAGTMEHPAEESALLREAGDSVARPTHEHDGDERLQASFGGSDSFVKTEQGADQPHPEHTRRRHTQQEKQQYEEKLHARMKHVQQQQEEVPKVRRDLEQQNEKHPKLRNISVFKKSRLQHPGTHARLQKTKSEGPPLYKKKKGVGRAAQKQHSPRPPTPRTPQKHFLCCAPEPHTLSSSSSSSACIGYQCVNGRSMKSFTKAHLQLSLCTSIRSAVVLSTSVVVLPLIRAASSASKTVAPFRSNTGAH